jgi:hypothetical protein
MLAREALLPASVRALAVESAAAEACDGQP